MSVTSTRRVSTSYSAPVKGGYEAAQGRQSFVETIDTTNNVLVSDDSNSAKNSYYPREKSEESFEEQISSSSEAVLDNSIHTGHMNGPLLDNDEDTENLMTNRSVGIYGANQTISSGQSENPNNPYLRHLYENNEVIEDIDEFI